jgi:IclR family transcriptional regulator, acetate operon repressor
MSDHRSPIVEKTLLLLGELGNTGAGASLADLTERLDVPRSTVYRILNSLQAHRFVVKLDGRPLYALGPRIEELAGTLSPKDARERLLEAAAPLMARIAARLSEACKLCVIEEDEALTLHAVPSPSDFGLSVRVGRRAPLYAGGAGKALLAFAPADVRTRVLSGPLLSHTPHTITNPDILRETIDLIRRQGFAEDNAELTVGIRALAAPIFVDGAVPAAVLSIPYLGDPTPERVHAIRQAVLEGAVEIGAALAPAHAEA